jgi:thiol:disulfide interchange protein
MVLATLAALVQLGLGSESYGWGELFTLTWFKVSMTALVFAMALSFLGVWEIPIPGFVGSGKTGELAQREGASGAFAKGVVTTVLATPCSGPFLGFVFGFTLNQPAYIVYMVFACIGLGMALPYLLIGAFPELIRALPRPGAWMETFKQAMGLVLLGTVAFLFSFIDKNYLAATFAILVSIWAGCWWIGKVPLTAEFGRKAVGWASGAALAAALGAGSFMLLRPHEPVLPWQPFSVAEVEKAKAAGKTVMIDFTADWCLTCKTNMKVAVDTHTTLATVQENNVVTFLADWTKPSDEIKRTLNSLGSNSIPVLAIFPAGQPERPIILRDLLGQQKVIDALKQAGPSKAGPLAPEAPKSAVASTKDSASNRYDKVLVLPPTPSCGIAPTDEEVIDAINEPKQFVLGRARITKVRIVDCVDSPRDFPLVGRAQFHHTTWKCTVTANEVDPTASESLQRAGEHVDSNRVVYLDHDDLHM